MKAFILGLLLVCLPGVTVFCQIAINNDGTAPDNSAMLDVKSLTKGILIPRLSLSQRNAISSPATGLMIYQTDISPGYYYNSGSAATPVWSLVGGLRLPYYGTYSNTSGFAFEVLSHGVASIRGEGYIGIIGNTNADEDGISFGYGISGNAYQTSGDYHGVLGTTSSPDGTGIFGRNYAESSSAFGVFGETHSVAGIGVFGKAINTTGSNYGVYGKSLSSNGTGVYGYGRYALQGETAEETGYGLNVKCTHTTGITRGVNVSLSSPNGFSGYFSGGDKFVVTTADVGIGLVSPSRRLTVYESSGISSANFVNDVSGTTSNDGLMIGYSGGGFMGGANIMNYESDPLYLGTDGQARVTISGAGNVGIGTVLPEWQLVIQAPDNGSRPMIQCKNGDGDEKIQLRQTSNGSGALYLWDGTNTNTVFLYGSGSSYVNGGNFGIGTTSPAYKLQVGVAGDGTQARANAWNLLSDARLKRDFSAVTNPLEMIEKINGYYYFWNTGTDKSRQIGFSAQEVKEVIPEIVSEGEDGYLSIEYGKMAPVLLEAIKELKKENDALKAELEKTSHRLDAMESLMKIYSSR